MRSWQLSHMTDEQLDRELERLTQALGLSKEDFLRLDLQTLREEVYATNAALSRTRSIGFRSGKVRP